MHIFDFNFLNSIFLFHFLFYSFTGCSSFSSILGLATIHTEVVFVEVHRMIESSKIICVIIDRDCFNISSWLLCFCCIMRSSNTLVSVHANHVHFWRHWGILPCLYRFLGDNNLLSWSASSILGHFTQESFSQPSGHWIYFGLLSDLCRLYLYDFKLSSGHLKVDNRTTRLSV